jgi:predicted PurR-regulated permease PerM
MARDGLARLETHIGGVFRFGQAVITSLIRGVFTFFLVLMIAAFILLDLEKIHAFARGLVPTVYRDDYDVIVAGIDRGLSGVIRGQLMICLVNGVLTYIGLVIFEVKYSLILAVVAAVLSLIPIFGSILSTIPIVVAALVSSEAGVDLAKAVLILAWIVGIHLLEANLLNPKIIGTAARIHPVLVIFALVVGEHSYGLTGALLAVPVASIVQVLFIFFRNKAWRDPPPREEPPPRAGSGSIP